MLISISRYFPSHPNHRGSFPRRLSIASPSTFFVRLLLKFCQRLTKLVQRFLFAARRKVLRGSYRLCRSQTG